MPYTIRLIENPESPVPIIEIDGVDGKAPLNLKLVDRVYQPFTTIPDPHLFGVQFVAWRDDELDHRGNPFTSGSGNAFDFKTTLSHAAHSLCQGWQPDENKPMPGWMARDWKIKKTQRIIAKPLLACWRKIIQQALETIPMAAMAQREYFVTQRQEGLFLPDFSIPHVLEDYKRFSAFVWFYSLFIRGHYSVLDTIGNIYQFWEQNEARFGENVITFTPEQRAEIFANWRGIMGAYHGQEKEQNAGNGIAIFGVSSAIWRQVDSFPTKPYRALNATLSNFPKSRVPQDVLEAFWTIQPKLPRPLLSRRELLWAMLSPMIMEPTFTHHRFNYDKAQIREGMAYYAEHICHEKRNPDRSEHIAELWSFIYDGARIASNLDVDNTADYVSSATSLVSLIRRSQEAHEWERRIALEREKERAEDNAALDSMIAPEPSVPLPATKDGILRLLKVASDFHNEGISMGHCIAGKHYLLRAMKGEAFYIHGEYKNCPFTAEVYADGTIAQIRGIRNATNDATKWGAKVLKRWAKQLAANPVEYGKLVASPELQALQDFNEVPF